MDSTTEVTVYVDDVQITNSAWSPNRRGYTQGKDYLA